MDIDSAKKRPLVLFQSAPYDGSLARASLDLALSLAVFAQDPVLVFSGDAVLGLQEKQNATVLGRKSLRKVVDSFPMYDIDAIFVDAASLAQRGVAEDDLPAFAVALDQSALESLIQEADHVISL